MSKTQLGVIFGSRSCEREVAIISAVQLMNHVDADKYDVIPVYISEQGVWYTGSALGRIETYKHFNPDAKDIEQVQLDVTSGSGALLAMPLLPPLARYFSLKSRKRSAEMGISMGDACTSSS